MIRKVIHISLIILGFILLPSRSCGPDTDINKEVRLKAEQDSTLKEIRDEFKSEYIFEDRLLAYGEKAKQKLLDFSDYLSLYSDKNMDTLFKQQVKDMIYRLFYNKNAGIQLFFVSADRTANNRNNLSGLLARIDESKYSSMEFFVSGLKTVEPLHLEEIDRYTGKLGCNFRISGITDNDTIILNETFSLVKIITTQTSKQFGADSSILVWQVFLDEVVLAN